MIPYTPHSLSRIETIFKDLGYKVRYEKGNFHSGSCSIQQSKVVVINKFISLEQKINSMIGILLSGPVQEELLDEKQRDYLRHVRQTSLDFGKKQAE